jgi:hypothetical protein
MGPIGITDNTGTYCRRKDNKHYLKYLFILLVLCNLNSITHYQHQKLLHLMCYKIYCSQFGHHLLCPATSKIAFCMWLMQVGVFPALSPDKWNRFSFLAVNVHSQRDIKSVPSRGQEKPVKITGATVRCMFFRLPQHYPSDLQINPLRLSPNHSATECQSFRFSVKIFKRSTLNGRVLKVFFMEPESTLGGPG